MSHPDDPTNAADLTLVEAARAGDRLAFGVLYLRHHAAAWRVACVVSRFSPDAELAVIEGFTRVFSALPAGSEELAAGGVSFRPYLLACVRQSALDRAAAAGRAEADPAPPAGAGRLAGLGPDGEVVLSSLEHHGARAALAAMPERTRTALWLTDVEALTPAEVAGILIGPAEETTALADGARASLHEAQGSAFDRQEARAACRFSVDHLDAYQAGTLDPEEGLLVRAHLQTCQVCRMRQGELANAPAALAAAVPPAPLLGGETQHHWLMAGDVPPAGRLLVPGLAAGGTAGREPLAHRAATHLGSVAGAALPPARRLPGALRRAAHAAAGTFRPAELDLTTRAQLRAAAPASPDDPVGRPGSASPPPRPGTGATDPTGRPVAPSRSEGAAGPDPPGPAGAADPTDPAGWTASPGWSGSMIPSFPPGWTAPPRRRPPARRRWTGASRAGGPTRRSGRRRGRATLPVLGLVLAWMLVMAMLPQLLAPGTAPGPDGMALPAVQAYVP
ncbi:MAG TPA: zf-HC2 domain-containing protein, partial [Acidimicrobiia bacterium]|nr:zf-HC2 domain-containing protein [Acidimicrobiia bacterium]